MAKFFFRRATEEGTHRAGSSSDNSTVPAMPLWVKVFGIIALIVILLFLILMLANMGGHGPGRHMGSGGNQAQLSRIVQYGGQQL